MADYLYDGLLRRLIELRDSGTNHKTATDELWGMVETDQAGYLRMFFHNWMNNNWSRPQVHPKDVRPYKPRPRPTPAELTEQRKADANLRGLALMNGFLSDGETRLKDATGAQVRREHGWLGLIAKHVGPKEIVGRKLTAEQLANLHSRTR